MIRLIGVFIAVLATFAAHAQDGASTAWAPGARSSARMIAAGDLQGGVYHAGVQIRLDPGTITYWRNPGEAGVPPVFSFAGSSNVAAAKVLFPAPMRIAEAGGVEAFGYEGGVIFPVEVTPVDSAKPVTLDLALTYAACGKICVPADARLALELAPFGQGANYAALLADAKNLVPKPLFAGAGVPDGLIVPVPAATRPSWIIGGSALGDFQAKDLFAEAPDGWYFETRPGLEPGQFLLVLAERPKSAPSVPLNLHLTLTGTDGAREFQTPLDVAAPKP